MSKVQDAKFQKETYLRQVRKSRMSRKINKNAVFTAVVVLKAFLQQI
jgi:hypothetical protein